jgi:hypothetical protein
MKDMQVCLGRLRASELRVDQRRGDGCGKVRAVRQAFKIILGRAGIGNYAEHRKGQSRRDESQPQG